MAETLRSDGKAVDVTAPDAGCTKGDVLLIDGFHGIAMKSAASGTKVALEIAQREHEINIGSVVAAKGAVLYLTAAGAISADSSGNRAFFKVTKAKNSGNYVKGIILPQTA
jgi:predicted RecA/RadA family phage recombinase